MGSFTAPGVQREDAGHGQENTEMSLALADMATVCLSGLQTPCSHHIKAFAFHRDGVLHSSWSLCLSAAFRIYVRMRSLSSRSRHSNPSLRPFLCTSALCPRLEHSDSVCRIARGQPVTKNALSSPNRASGRRHAADACPSKRTAHWRHAAPCPRSRRVGLTAIPKSTRIGFIFSRSRRFAGPRPR